MTSFWEHRCHNSAWIIFLLPWRIHSLADIFQSIGLKFASPLRYSSFAPVLKINASYFNITFSMRQKRQDLKKQTLSKLNEDRSYNLKKKVDSNSKKFDRIFFLVQLTPRKPFHYCSLQQNSNFFVVQWRQKRFTRDKLSQLEKLHY